MDQSQGPVATTGPPPQTHIITIPQPPPVVQAQPEQPEENGSGLPQAERPAKKQGAGDPISGESPVAPQVAASQVRTLQYQDPDLHYPGQGETKQGVSVFLFGGVGTWKTTFAGTFPKPLFLSVGPEGGDDALAMLPELYGIQVPPTYHVTSPDMMLKKVDRIIKDYVAMGINTVIVDSITYYVDMWVAQLMELRYKDPKIRKRIE